MKNRIVVALGGNAILSAQASASAQEQAVFSIVGKLVSLIEDGNELIISHGNGPQVGNLLLQQIAAHSGKNPALPLDTLVSMTQGSIGYWIQKAMDQEMMARGIHKEVATIITQVQVDAKDPAFENPTKPIGPFFTEAEAKDAMEKEHAVYKEDAGRGWRRVVASPKPVSIKEYPVVKRLLDDGVVTIVAGGGGIPVIYENGKTIGVEAVIDKDLAAEKLAELIEADRLIFLTGVDNVYIYYNTPRQEKLTTVTVGELQEYIRENLFAVGSMLPKIEAAIAFVLSGEGREAVITSLDQVGGIDRGAGTRIIR